MRQLQDSLPIRIALLRDQDAAPIRTLDWVTGDCYLRFWRWLIRARFVVYCHRGSCHASSSATAALGGSAGVSSALMASDCCCSCSAGFCFGGAGDGDVCCGGSCTAALSCGGDTAVAGADAGLSGGDGSTLCGARSLSMRCSTIRSATAVGSTGGGGGVGSAGGGDKAAAGGSGCTTGAGVRGAGARGGGAGGGGGGGCSCSGACGLHVNSGLAASSSSETPWILRRMANRLISATTC